MSCPRRTALAWIAVMHLGMALWVLGPASIDPERAIFFERWPVEARAAVWAIAGLATSIGALTPRLIRFGYTVAAIMPVERAVGHLWSWLEWARPGPPAGDPYGLGMTIWWTGLVALIIWAGRRADEHGLAE